MLNLDKLELVCNDKNAFIIKNTLLDLDNNLIKNLEKYMPRKKDKRLEFKIKEKKTDKIKREISDFLDELKEEINKEKENIDTDEDDELSNSISKKLKIVIDGILDYSSIHDSSISKKWMDYFFRPVNSFSFGEYHSHKNFQYQRINASGVFVPLIQTYYESDAKKISESTERTPLSLTYRDIKERVRVSVMNVEARNNYIDPDLDERFKIWHLFLFNLNLTCLYHHYFST